MMKSMISAVVGVAGLAAASNAAWGLKFEVWNGSSWVSSVNAVQGDVVKFRFGSYFDANSAPTITTADGTGTAQALTRFTGSNQATGFAAGDVFQNVVRTISSGNPALIQVAGATIGTSAVTSFGSQLFLAGLPDPAETYKEIYTGEVKIGADVNARLITIKNKTFGSGATAGLTFYNSASPVNKQSAAPSGGSDRVDLNATINVLAVPAPGALALVGLGGLVAARRRRA
ncbi:MAG: hypothetical protein U0570_09395 [Phycisphaerales bacterium]